MTEEINSSPSQKMELRNYQKLVVDESLSQNTLVILPTGSGKTLIATHIINERLSLLRKNGIKKILAFLAPTKVLVGQQQRYLSFHLNQLSSDVNVVSFTGETSSIDGKSISYWNQNGWTEVFKQTDVLVMTPQICKQMLQRKFFQIEDFDCLVLDECHHATGEHPLVYVCTCAKESNPSPLMFCMTASPILSKKGSITENLEKLEATLGCRLLCMKEVLEQYQEHTNEAELKVYRYHSDETKIVDLIISGNSPNYLQDFKSVLEMPNDLHFIFTSAFIRAKHAGFLASVYTLLFNMRTEPSEFPFFNDSFPSLQTYRIYRKKCRFTNQSSQVASNHIFSFSSKLTFGGLHRDEIIQTLGQILKITEESGTLSGLYAFLAAIGNNKRAIASKSEKFTDLSLKKNELGFRQALDFSGDKKKHKNDSAFELSSTGGLTDMERVESLAKELSVSPFQLIDLLHDEYSYCVTIYDFFYGLAASLGPEVCYHGLKKFVQLQNRQEQSEFILEVKDPKDTEMCCLLPVGSIIIYILLQSIIEREAIEGFDIEGVFNIVVKNWSRYVVSNDEIGEFVFSSFELRERDCYKTLLSAGWCLLCNVSKDELKEWMSLDDGSWNSFLEPLVVEPKLPMWKSLSPDNGSFQLSVISKKVKALCKVWNLMSEEEKDAMLTEGAAESAHIIFCKMRLQAISLHFILSTVVDNLFPQDVPVADAALEDRDRAEVRQVLTEMLDIVCDERSDRVHWACEGRNAITIPQFRFSHMTGHILQKTQLELLKNFKAGEFNVVVATDVMEEGLDVRACKYVINFDLPGTLKSFVQRKGRSRAKDSLMISLIPYGDDGDSIYDELVLLHQQEKAIEHHSSLSEPLTFDIFEQSTVYHNDTKEVVVEESSSEMEVCVDDDSDLLCDFMMTSTSKMIEITPSKLESYKVESTGAEIDGKTSTQILYRFCQRLPHDSFYEPKPIFWLTKTSVQKNIVQYVCSVLLPPHVESRLRFVVGPSAPNKSLAKGFAAMECVKLLHEAGELNDYLMIVGDKSSRTLDRVKNLKVASEIVHKKQKLSARIKNEIDLENVEDDGEEIVDNKVAAEEDFQLNEENKDLLKISSKFAPDCLLPSSAFKGRHSVITLYFYVFQATFSDQKSQEITDHCPSCSEYYHGLNSFGLALLAPVPEEILNDSFRCYIRESEGVDVLTAFIECKEVTEEELIHMQRFHKGILSWESENGKFVSDDGTMNWLQTNDCKSYLWPNCDAQYPVPAEEWCLSGNGGWYLIFPLPEINDLPLYCDNMSALGKNKAQSYCSLLMQSETYLNPSLWAAFLQDCADEAQVLAHNLGVQDYLNVHGNPGFILPLNRSSTAESLQGMLISRGFGGVHTVCEMKTSDDHKRLTDIAKQQPKEQVDGEIKENVRNLLSKLVSDVEQHDADPSFNLKGTLDIYDLEKQRVNTVQENRALAEYFELASQNVVPQLPFMPPTEGKPPQELVGTTFLQLQLKRYPNYKNEILDLSKDANHILCKAVAMVCKLTLHCLITKSANRYVRPQRFYSNLLTGLIATTQSTFRERKRRFHTHAAPLFLIPELCQVLGKCKWYAVGLVAPSLIWRIESLLLAVEAKNTLIKAIVKFDKNLQKHQQLNHSTDQEEFDFNLICHTLSEKSNELLFPVPKASLMLEAISPRLVGEMIDSERLELLGDSLLKLVTTVEVFRLFPTKHEGFLTFERCKVISNLFLFERCCKLGLHHYVRAIPLSSGKQQLLIRPCGMGFTALTQQSSFWNKNLMPRIITAPGQKPSNGTEEMPLLPTELEEDINGLPEHLLQFQDAKSYFKNVFPIRQHQYAEVKPKVLADAMEAIIGAFYISGGLNAGIAIIKTIGAWPTFETLNKKKVKPAVELVEPMHEEMMMEEKMEVESPMVETSSSSPPPDEYALQIKFLEMQEENDDSAIHFPENYPEPLKRIVLGLKNNLLEIQQLNETSEMQPVMNVREEEEENLLIHENYIQKQRVKFPLPPSSLPFIPPSDQLSHEKTDVSTESKSFGFSQLLPQQIIEEFSGILNYSFQNWKILQEALTHCSCQEKVSNQRFEFLGDAVLDFAVVTLLFAQQPWSTPGDLSKQKSDITCNRNLGKLGIKFKLFKYLKFSSARLADEFEDLLDLLQELEEEKNNNNSGNDNIPIGIDNDVVVKEKEVEKLAPEAEVVQMMMKTDPSPSQYVEISAIDQILASSSVLMGEEASYSSFSALSSSSSSSASALPPPAVTVPFTLMKNYQVKEEELFTVEELMSTCIQEMIVHIETGSQERNIVPEESHLPEKEQENSLQIKREVISIPTAVPKPPPPKPTAARKHHHVAKISQSTSKAVADLFEAVIGAIFLDANCDFDRVVEVIRHLQIVPPVEYEKDQESLEKTATIGELDLLISFLNEDTGNDNNNNNNNNNNNDVKIEEQPTDPNISKNETIMKMRRKRTIHDQMKVESACLKPLLPIIKKNNGKIDNHSNAVRELSPNSVTVTEFPHYASLLPTLSPAGLKSTPLSHASMLPEPTTLLAKRKLFSEEDKLGPDSNKKTKE
jgi:ERCC4-related helicase/dsRNA-specific ribonuclease